MTLASLISVVSGMLGLVAFLAAALAVATSTRQKATIQTLKDDNDAQRSWNETVERREQECQTRLDAAELRVKVLTDTVTNAEAVAKLLARVDLQHADLKELRTTVDTHFAMLITSLKGKGEA